uniref:RNA helicase n=1 Tax=Macrostomum lignano TaxID=282301 RepID=A0A1I8JEU0_9PLAT
MSLVPWRFDSPYADERNSPVRNFCLAGHRLAIVQDLTSGPIGPAEGTTGRRLWSAGFLLANLISKSADCLPPELRRSLSIGHQRQRQVLELGAGCGLPSLVCACRGAQVVATDSADSLPHLRRSIDANASLADQTKTSIEVATLDWANPNKELLLGRDWLAVIGADLFFDPAASAALFDSTLRPLLQSRPGLVCAFVYKRRGLAGEAEFLDRLRQAAGDGRLEWSSEELQPMPEFADPSQHRLPVQPPRLASSASELGVKRPAEKRREAKQKKKQQKANAKKQLKEKRQQQSADVSMRDHSVLDNSRHSNRESADEDDDDDEKPADADADLEAAADDPASGSAAPQAEAPIDPDLVDADEVKPKAKKGRKQAAGPATPGFADEIDRPDLPAGSSFLALNLSRPLLRALAELSWSRPTPIQAACVPIALAGRDICACARTGSGKTAAFLLPVIERLLYKPAGPPVTRVLVLSPTRELAVQIHSVAEQLLRYCGRRVSLSLSAGGLDLRGQEAALRQGPDIVVATPGRLIDHAHNAPSFHLRNIEILVLLFSATMTDDVRELSAMALRNPVKLFLSDKADVTLRLQQEFVRIREQRESDREAIVAALVQRSFNERCIVFCPTRRLCHRMHVLLGLLGVSCAELHSSLSQAQRLEALERFHKAEVGVLLATDLVSRGLDIQGVRTVINYSLPDTLKVYTHRVGRTARAGKQGLAISLAGEAERPLLKQIVRKAPIPVKLRTVPKSTVAAYRERIAALEPDVSAVMQEERLESAQRAAEQSLNRVQKRLEAAGSSGSRSQQQQQLQRNWFRARGGCNSATAGAASGVLGAGKLGKARGKKAKGSA